MIEIKNNKLIIGDKVKELSDVNIIRVVKGCVHFGNNLADYVQYECDMNTLYQTLINAGYEDFKIVNNAIVNIANISYLHIKFYQYAGISIYQSDRENSELSLLNLVCNNGKTEIMPFSTFQEAEQCYHEIDILITNYKNKEAKKGFIETC